MIWYLVARNPDLTSVNCVVGECNDAYLNDIRGCHVHAEHVVAPLDRAALGLARTGSPAGHGSGDFVIAFSNGNLVPHRPIRTVLEVRTLAEDGPAIGELFQATVETVEEAIPNSLFRAETVVGCDGHVREALPVERVAEIFQQHGRRLTIA